MNYCSFGHYCVDCADDTGYTDSQVVAYWQNIDLRCARFASYLIQLSFTFEDLHDPQNLTTSLSWRWWCQFHVDVCRDYKPNFLRIICNLIARRLPFVAPSAQSFPALSGGTTEPEWGQNCLCDSSPQRREEADVPALIPTTWSELPALVFVCLLCGSTRHHATSSRSNYFFLSANQPSLQSCVSRYFVFLFEGMALCFNLHSTWTVRLLESLFQGVFLFLEISVF